MNFFCLLQLPLLFVPSRVRTNSGLHTSSTPVFTISDVRGVPYRIASDLIASYLVCVSPVTGSASNLIVHKIRKKEAKEVVLNARKRSFRDPMRRGFRSLFGQPCIGARLKLGSSGADGSGPTVFPSSTSSSVNLTIFFITLRVWGTWEMWRFDAGELDSA